MSYPYQDVFLTPIYGYDVRRLHIWTEDEVKAALDKATYHHPFASYDWDAYDARNRGPDSI